MAGQTLRRSGRATKPVKRYCDEQADEEDNAKQSKPASRKRQKVAIEHEEPPTRESNRTKGSDEKPADQTNTTSTIKASTSRRPKPKPVTYDRAWHGQAAERRIAATNRKLTQLAPGEEEVRLRGYVDEPPQSYHDFLKRANTQRMYILDRERGVEEACHANHHDCPCEIFQIAGSKGNVYKVTISHLPSCTCPVGIFTRKGGEKLCKHALYVLHHVLKAPGHLEKQNAFLTSELREIFANAPAAPEDIAEDQIKDGNRKPVVDECPICCMDFEEGEDLVWCQAACGNNLHKACFDQWAQMKSNVTCPYCRSVWQFEDTSKKKSTVTKVNMPKFISNDGYRNVRDQLDYEDV